MPGADAPVFHRFETGTMTRYPDRDKVRRHSRVRLRQVPVEMTRFGEICSIVAATFWQILRSAIKKAGDFYSLSAEMRH